MCDCAPGFVDADGVAANGCECAEGGAETCDGVDNDCDGQTDEAGAAGCVQHYEDADNDGFGDGGSAGACTCGPEAPFFVTVQGDCNDGAVAINPDADELCNTPEDDNCDGQANEGFVGLGDPCDGDDSDPCANGVLECAADGLSVVCGAEVAEDLVETCAGDDEDCDDGNTDDGDGCSSSCAVEASCGNGSVEPPEECDEGPALPTATCNAQCMFVPQAPVEGLVYFTEILFNPANTLDSNGEWFELHNEASVPVDLSGCVIADSGSDTVTMPPGTVIPPSGFVTMGKTADTVTNDNVSHVVVYGTAVDLSNGTDDLTLSCSGNVRDTVAWDNGATFPNPVGSSVALCPDKFSKEANDLGANWSTSGQPWAGGDGGSPGAANPQCLP